MSDNLDELGVNGEFEEDGREIVLDTSGEVELTDDVTEGVAELRETLAQQDSEAENTRLNSSRRSCASAACVSRGRSFSVRSCANST